MFFHLFVTVYRGGINSNKTRKLEREKKPHFMKFSMVKV